MDRHRQFIVRHLQACGMNSPPFSVPVEKFDKALGTERSKAVLDSLIKDGLIEQFSDRLKKLGWQMLRKYDIWFLKVRLTERGRLEAS